MLDRKLRRDLAHMKGQVLAIGLVMACGLATFIMSLSTFTSLSRTQQSYYRQYRFPDVFAHLTRGPNPLAARIAEIPGVGQVETRIVRDVVLDVPGLREPAVGRLISLPPYRQPRLSALYLRRGRFPEAGRRNEVLVGEAFAVAHGFNPGDGVDAIIAGRRRRLSIVGVALSPEYIFQIRAGEVLPDDTRFGIFWMPKTELEAAFDMEGAFNDVVLSLRRGASDPEVIRRLDLLVEPFGGTGAYGRDDQLSHRYLSDELQQLRAMALVAPSIFLAVAAFLLHVVISRLVGMQREQVAVLKAFGYSRREVGAHYLKFVLAIVLLGTVLGTVAGSQFGQGLTRLYTRFYRFPIFEFHLDPAVLALAMSIAVGAALTGTWGAVRRAVRLPAAEAMRPEPPATFRPLIAERLGLTALFSPVARMILRQLERRPVKSLLSSVGISLSAAVLVLGAFSEDSINFLMEFEFEVSQRQELTVTLLGPTSGHVIHELAQLPGVTRAEPFRTLSARIRSGHRSRRVAIQGLDAKGILNPLIDADGQRVTLPAEGLVLSQKLADLLGVRRGDLVQVEVLEGARPVRQVPVVDLVTEFAGTRAYMNLQAARRLMREGDTVSGADLAVDQQRLDTLYTRLKNTPRVAGVAVRRAALDSFRQTVAENLLRMRTFNILFACIIAFGVVYNTARISLSERDRELATLRVIGFTRGEISFILLGELAVLTAIAIPVGLLLGYGLAALATRGLETELYRIPLVVEPSTFGFATMIVLAAALASGLVVRRRLDRLDLIAVLKSRE